VKALDEVVIWPAFLDSELSRSQGRRLRRKRCVKSPTLDEMLEAATAAGMGARVEKKSYPRRWRTDRKALVLEERVPRSNAIAMISDEIRRTRSA
jgi:signal recognition particle subunit SRP19